MDPLRRELRQSADALVHRLARIGIELGYEREGVVALDAYVEANRALWSVADRERLATELAAFVGECMVETYDLRWRADADGVPGLVLASRTLASPRALANARLDGAARLTDAFDRIGVELAHE